MSRSHRSCLLVAILSLIALLFGLAACGSSPLLPGYQLKVSALNPSSIVPGGTSTATITVTPTDGYTGSVSLSCVGVKGAKPAPSCSFSPSVVDIGGGAGSSVLKVSSISSTPAGSYTITVSASDAKNLAPANGPQALPLSVVIPAYTLRASPLSPGNVVAGTGSTSTITVTPVNSYTGSVSLSCSVTGGTPAPACSLSASPVAIKGTSAVTSTLSVSTTRATPGGLYTVRVSAIDAENLAPSNGSQNLSMTTTAVIQNVVIIFQENRTPDNLFQGLCLPPYGSASACSTTPGAAQYNIQTSNWLNSASSTGVTQPGVVALDNDYDLSHKHDAFTEMCDYKSATNACAMDGAAQITITCNKDAPDCPAANMQYMYVNPSDVVPYFQMAQTYAFADEMFQSNEGPSFPAHQFILSGTSEPSIGSTSFAAENMGGTGNAGCVAPSDQTVELINPAGVEYTTIYPCFEHQTLTDLLDAANVSWRYYAPTLGSIWTAPTAIQHMCGPNDPPPNGTACEGTDYTDSSPKVVLNQSQTNAQIISDISNGQLQQVSWVIPNGNDSDHAASNTGCGPSWVTEVVDAIGNSPYWSNTTIIITWDDWGGWYDHVPPKLINDGVSWGSGYVYGFRVPMLVISPYIQPGYISHETHDFGSILKYIESNYNLPSLGFADAYADNLSDFFHLSSAPINFQAITPPSDDATCKGDPAQIAEPDND
jgi:phospholipase C